LDKHDMAPELYACSWFITLFANRLAPPLLLRLWDVLLLHAGDATLILFFCVALMREGREVLLNADGAELPLHLMRLVENVIGDDAAALEHLLLKAVHAYRKKTCSTMRATLAALLSWQAPPETGASSAGSTATAPAPALRRLLGQHWWATRVRVCVCVCNVCFAHTPK
jgi:hypothetical protein